MSISRRLILQALPFIGASAAIPATIAAPIQDMTTQEQIDHHVNALAALIDGTAGDCDGWTCCIHWHPADYDGAKVTGARFWSVDEKVGDRLLPIDRKREFDPLTGAHVDRQPMPDLTVWAQRIHAPTR